MKDKFTPYKIISLLILLLMMSCYINKTQSTPYYINPTTKKKFVEIEGDFLKEMYNDTVDVSLFSFGKGGSYKALYLLKYNEGDDMEKMYKSGIYGISSELVIDTVSKDTVSINSLDDYFKLFNFYSDNKDTCTYRYYPKWWSTNVDSSNQTFDGFCYYKYRLKLICAKADSTDIFMPNINSSDTVGHYFIGPVKVPLYTVVRIQKL
jgi:hypothetical protein